MKTFTTLAAVGTLAMAVPALAADTTTTTSGSTTPTAEQQCRTERAQMGTATFAQTYGTNKSRKDAFGKCVSKRSKATDSASTAAHDSAVQSCRSEQAADSAAFAKKYGTGKNGRNAFGKCVSAKAKAQGDATSS